jgi:hypothetical protein
MKQNNSTAASPSVSTDANTLVRQILDREWLQQGATQKELDIGRLLGERFNTELAAGYTAEEILQKWQGRSPDEILRGGMCQ